MSSGAKIIVLDDTVIKVHNTDRLNRQAEWLMAYPGDGIVKVLGEWHHGYAMERLDPLDRDVTADDVVELLRSFVWPNRPQVRLNWDAVEAYVSLRCAQFWPEASGIFKMAVDKCRGKNLTTGRVHGDPTFANVMMRGAGLVLIDPIPGCAYAPDVLAVDLGKILQSCYGYEQVLTGQVVNDPDIAWLDEFAPDERFAARTFAVAHIARMLPYLPDDESRENMRETVGAHSLYL